MICYKMRWYSISGYGIENILINELKEFCAKRKKQEEDDINGQTAKRGAVTPARECGYDNPKYEELKKKLEECRRDSSDTFISQPGEPKILQRKNLINEVLTFLSGERATEAELRTLKVSHLRKRAREAGVEEEAINEAAAGGEAKLVNLIVERTATAQMQERKVVEDRIKKKVEDLRYFDGGGKNRRKTHRKKSVKRKSTRRKSRRKKTIKRKKSKKLSRR